VQVQQLKLGDTLSEAAHGVAVDAVIVLVRLVEYQIEVPHDCPGAGALVPNRS
jgi:hypothetical protein